MASLALQIQKARAFLWKGFVAQATLLPVPAVARSPCRLPNLVNIDPYTGVGEGG